MATTFGGSRKTFKSDLQSQFRPGYTGRVDCARSKVDAPIEEQPRRAKLNMSSNPGERIGQSLTVASRGDVYLADAFNHRVRRVESHQLSEVRRCTCLFGLDLYRSRAREGEWSESPRDCSGRCVGRQCDWCTYFSADARLRYGSCKRYHAP